jgi:hypothetical protein
VNVLKCDFGDVVNRFHNVEGPFERIFFILGIEKTIWRNLLKWFQVAEWHWELIICLVNVLKCDFGDDNEKMFHDVERKFERFFFILRIQKNVFDEKTMVKSMMRWFKVLKGHCNSIFASLTSKKANWMKSFKWF